MKLLKFSKEVKGERHIVSTWKCKSFIERLRFLFNGEINVIETGLTSTKMVCVGDPWERLGGSE